MRIKNGGLAVIEVSEAEAHMILEGLFLYSIQYKGHLNSVMADTMIEQISEYLRG